MKGAVIGLGFTLAVAVAVGSFGIQSVQATNHAYKSKAKITGLIQGTLPGVAGKTVIIKHFELPPGHVGGRHLHPGAVYVYILEGALTIETEGQTRTVSAGELYKEPLRRVMQSQEPEHRDGVKFVAFQVGDEGKPMMIKAK
jgi:quercetin dioxygenase-like cupin family protein